jgi:hypothetical protein
VPIARERIIWIALIACAAALSVAAPSAVAQEQTPGARSRSTVEPYRPARSRTQPDGFDDGPAAPDLPAPIPGDDPSAIPQDADDFDQQPRAGQRAVRQDGDLSDPETPQLRDGVIDTGEAAAPVDGSDATTVDSRPREDAQLFEAPVSTVDALLFQVEELEPILDRRFK